MADKWSMIYSMNYRNSSKPLVTNEEELIKFKEVKKKLDFLATNHFDHYR